MYVIFCPNIILLNNAIYNTGQLIHRQAFPSQQLNITIYT